MSCFCTLSSLAVWMFKHGCQGTYTVLGVLYACVLYFGICVEHVERSSRNTIIIILIIPLCARTLRVRQLVEKPGRGLLCFIGWLINVPATG